jgi:hypothetical protein
MIPHPTDSSPNGKAYLEAEPEKIGAFGRFRPQQEEVFDVGAS